MDLDFFVKNIKFYCSAKGIKPTVACREAGVGQSFINNMELKGSVPSVEKVQRLAQYLGVTVSELLGEAPPDKFGGELPPQETLVLRDSAVVGHPTDVKRLTVAEVEMVMAYRRATQKERRLIDDTLAEYKEKSTSVG